MDKKKKLQPWSVISSTVVHKNKWFKVVWDKFVTPALTIGNYFTIHTNGTNKSILLVVVEDGKIYFVKQFRYPSGKWMLEVPGGGVEEGSDTLGSAKIELREELGLEAGNITKVGEFFPWGSRTPEVCSVILATELTYIGQKLEETEKGLEIIKIDIKEAYRMVDEGEILDGVTLAALSKVRQKLLV